MRPTLAALPVAVDISPMEARLVGALPSEPGWRFEPKWDGFRCLAFRAGEEVEIRSKSGRSLSRYFPEVVAMLAGLAVERFVVDGELAIPLGDTLSFDALQMRLHPAASRIRKLSIETPAMLIAFDCLMDSRGRGLIDAPLSDRRAALEDFTTRAQAPAWLRPTPYTRERRMAERWLDRAGGALDGVVGKRLDRPYEPGARAMVKIKRLRSADCVVGGFRYEHDSRSVGSLLLGLYNAQGSLDHVGFTSSFGDLDRAALTGQLERLSAPPGFTGKRPGGPSRWSTERSGEWQPLRPELVAEVRYDNVTGERFRHGTKFLRWRPDKAPEQCTFEQLEGEVRPALLADVVRSMTRPAPTGDAARPGQR